MKKKKDELDLYSQIDSEEDVLSEEDSDEEKPRETSSLSDKELNILRLYKKRIIIQKQEITELKREVQRLKKLI
jgi:hypothetical protein